MCEPEITDWIKQASAPMAPVPTGTSSTGVPLQNIRAVLFDVYGTMLVSGSGDIGLAAAAEHQAVTDFAKTRDASATRKREPHKSQSNANCRAAACGVPQGFAIASA